MAVPYSFATQTGSIPLSQLDSNFATAITLGNTAVVLGNTYSTIGNLTLSNVTISSGNVSINVSNVSTLNVVTSTVTGNETVGGNVTITGNVSVNVANVTTLNATSSTITGNETVGGNVTVTGNVSVNNATFSNSLTLSGGTANGVAYLNGSKVLTTGSALTFDGTKLTLANDASISGLTVGKGGGAIGSNSAFGPGALSANTTGAGIVAVGYQAFATNTTGVSSTVIGFQSLFSNTTGGYNVGVGSGALYNNTTASYNTAVGFQAGYSNTTGLGNVYFGRGAGLNATGGNLVFVGQNSGYSSTGDGNCFVGQSAGFSMTSGAKNTILGSYNGNQGGLDIRTASNYIVLSDGDGNPYAFVNSSGYFKTTNSISGGINSITGTYAEFGQTANDNGLMVQNFNTSQTGNGLIYVSNRNTTNNTFYAISYYNNPANAYKFRVADSGNVTNTNNSYGAISDIKLKENIVDATPKLEDLCKVKVRQYNLKSDPDHKQIGVVAQELEEVFAGLVDEAKDTDKDGNDLGTTTKQVKYSVFVPMLIKAVQELKAEVDSLKSQLGTK